MNGKSSTQNAIRCFTDSTAQIYIFLFTGEQTEKPSPRPSLQDKQTCEIKRQANMWNKKASFKSCHRGLQVKQNTQTR
jgi:hypothetical protein